MIQSLRVGILKNIGEYNYLPFIEKLTTNGIPVVITSKYPILPEMMDKYEPASGPIDKGAIPAGNMTGSAAFAKLSWLLPQIKRDIANGRIKPQHKLVELQKRLIHNYIGEIDRIPMPKRKE